MQLLEKMLMQVQKPSRYIGGELNSVIKKKDCGVTTFAFCFPDTYEVGMSNLGMKILYHLLNESSEICCERVFAPTDDMEGQLRENGYPLFSLETKTPVKEFDFIGFTLQTELSYTNVLNMLDLSGVPLLSSERGEDAPVVIAGGSCAYNPEPLADFIDLFVLGEGESALIALIELYRECGEKSEFLAKAALLQGVYIPSFYTFEYLESGEIKSFTPKLENAPLKIKKNIVTDMDASYFPDRFIVPFCDIVHDRAMLELYRGCIRGCRFCQAGFIYRPVREKRADTLNAQARSLIDSTGYNEVSLLSLSTSDYSQLPELTDKLQDWCGPEGVSFSLPSLRIDNFSGELADKLAKVRKSGLTFAPEAGTQRLRDIINKGITEEDILSTCGLAFANGYSSVKLYFMIGLPFETDEDILGIAELASKVLDAYYKNKPEKIAKGVSISVSVSSFVPKPFTPFQWAGQDSTDELQRKQRLLRDAIKSRKITLHWHDSRVSAMEAVFARGDRRLSKVLAAAFRRGAKFDNWDTHFDYNIWVSAFEECGLEPDFYSVRERSFCEILPWDHIDTGVRKEYLIDECERARAGDTTPNCRKKCSGCGANTLTGGRCLD